MPPQRTLLGPISPSRVRKAELSPYIRGQIIGQRFRGASLAQIADAFNLEKSTIQYTIEKAIERPEGETKPRPGRPNILSDRDERTLLRHIRFHPKDTFEEIKKAVDLRNPVTKKPISTNTIKNYLSLLTMSEPRLSKGQSDPISYTCICEASSIGGTVLLFYRYWSNVPHLSSHLVEKVRDLESLAAWHKSLTESHNITGKIRVAREGYNVTVAGTSPEIEAYIRNCCQHWSFAGLQLDTEEERRLFFKPSDGCACVFGAERKANVRITAEITPMGVEGYAPSEWGNIEALPPAEFHRRCHEEKTLLLDVRNIYESRIGYFVDPQTGEPALRPPIRRFSQWPQYITHHLQGMRQEEKQIMTYCTGGIRCEKATRWMQEKIGSQRGTKSCCTLQGGIAAYLSWMEEEIRHGRKKSTESLFRGRNYVFDGRGSIGLETSAPVIPVSKCHLCGEASDDLSKCRSRGCHLILVICAPCNTEDPRCCQSCHDADADTSLPPGPRPMCACEREREAELWAGQRVKPLKTQGWKKAKRKAPSSTEHAAPQIEIVD